MRSNILVFLATASLALPVFAAEKKAAKVKAAPAAPVQSERGSMKTSLFMYQTDSNVFQLTPSFDYSLVDIDFEPEGSSESKSTNFGLMAEYGLNEMLSVGVDLNSRNSKTKVSVPGFTVPDATQSGLADPSFFLNGRMVAGPGVLRFGGNLNYSLGDSKANNNYSGGHSLNGFVGYEMTMDSAIYGARISYDLFKGEQTSVDDQGNKTKTEGGKSFAVAGFYETDIIPILIGGAVVVSAMDKSTSEGATVGASSTQMGLSVYGHYLVNPDLQILPNLAYTMPLAYDKAAIKSNHSLLAQVGARFSF